jgi:predicted HD phosphohydrolase
MRYNQENKDKFAKVAATIQDNHSRQTKKDVARLTEEYSLHNPTKKVFDNPVGIWEAIQSLGLVHDPTDKDLWAISQLTHTTQVVESMEKDGVIDEELLITAWLHDLGKLLLLTDEDPANIVCLNYVIEGEHGAGLANCICTWNHDEFAYQKLHCLLPERAGWLLRYHSLNLDQAAPYLNQEDWRRVDEWLRPFMQHDKLSKSIYHFPQLNWDYHRQLLETYVSGELIL